MVKNPASSAAGRPAQTRCPSIPTSPHAGVRGCSTATPFKAEQLAAVLEAARWAATWGHRQPVRFLVGQRGDETFIGISELLKRGNSYAKAAGALILVCTDEGEDERTARYAAVDTGAAIAQ